MSLLLNEFKNVSLNLELLKSVYDETLKQTVIQINFQVVTPNRIYSYIHNSGLILWKIALESLLKELKQLHLREVKEVSFYPVDMYFIFEIERFDVPDDTGIQWSVKFPSGIHYGVESAGYEEAIIFVINDSSLRNFIDGLEKELAHV
ncbi:hypothetical protein [Acinetobacter sp. ANC 3882]|uniref:WapI family immunity protein n=1 Tax=Acinetobacter sp. ANC 3882 TaxID=2923423 RepID=UPI001F4A5F41|nr:hypothetical protein [Acinetobacter sp. ANC 3882]MCH7314199.1 hypothetical protein [Acinetobacter sp. ANC 3882]